MPCVVLRRRRTSGAKYCGVPQKVLSPSDVARLASPKSVIFTWLVCCSGSVGVGWDGWVGWMWVFRGLVDTDLDVRVPVHEQDVLGLEIPVWKEDFGMCLRIR